jgi:NADH:ubiquinone oxidoreductase subunit 4 (subunit M)
MAAGAKIAGFAALVRIFVVALPSISEQIVPVLWALSALTLVVGNVLAIAQSNVKRMLAYSSISHAGFLLMALVAYGQDAARFDVVASTLFYLLAFVIASFGSWAVVIALEKRAGKGLDFKDYAGLGQKEPLLAPCCGNDRIHAFFHWSASHAGFCGQILYFSHSTGRWLHLVGHCGCANLAGLRLLLLASRRCHVHAEG